MSKKEIDAPVLTPNDVSLPYFPGFLYVAYEPEVNDDVSIIISKLGLM